MSKTLSPCCIYYKQNLVHTHIRNIVLSDPRSSWDKPTSTDHSALWFSPSLRVSQGGRFTFTLHFTFSRCFYPKRLTYVQLTMYTHFTFTLMAHCTSGAIRGSVSFSRTLQKGIELATFWLLNDLSTSCTTVAPILVGNGALRVKVTY